MKTKKFLAMSRASKLLPGPGATGVLSHFLYHPPPFAWRKQRKTGVIALLLLLGLTLTIYSLPMLEDLRSDVKNNGIRLQRACFLCCQNRGRELVVLQPSSDFCCQNRSAFSRCLQLFICFFLYLKLEFEKIQDAFQVDSFSTLK